jgi:signal transduction histidine kinase
VVLVFRDISGRRQAEKQIAKLTRLYSALSRVNETIIRIRDAGLLYQEICRIVSEEGDFPLVWIGQVRGKDVVPVAWHGSASDYLGKIKVQTEGPLGQGPTGTSIREQRAVINGDFSTNPAMAPWREVALGYGIRGSAAFPLKQDGEAIASLTLYSNTAGSFDEEQIRLIDSLCANISYALEALNHERLQELAEEELRESEAKYRNLFENMTEEVHIWRVRRDGSGRVITWRLVDANPPTLATWEKSLAEIKGKTTDEIFGPGATAHYLPIVERIMTEGVPFSFEDYFPNLDKFFRFTSIPLGDCFITTGVDITKIKKAQNLAEQQQDRLETANKELESFAYTVSHDLRAPLRAIDGFTRMLTRDVQGKLDQEENRKFEIIRENARKMGRLIDELLAFSRIGRQYLSLSPFGMRRLVEQVWEECRIINDGRLMELKVGDLPQAFGDSGLVKQVLSNLISNAVKFTRSRENALIEIGGRTNGHENIYFVRDNGAGFDMQYYDKLFGVFQRLHHEKDFEGTGVGLAIVQRIIHRHGGRVWAEGKVGEGAVFYFTLPQE